MKELLTPCILQTIIICCTIISLAMIAVSAFRVWKEKEKHDSGTYVFISGSIIFIAITIFSYGFYQNNDILSFTSLASSIISIILAVVTIIYSFYTNNNSSNQVEKLNTAADKVEHTTNAYIESADKLNNKVDEILIKLNNVENTTSQLVNQKVIFNIKDEQNTDTQTDISDEMVDKVVNNTSIVGILALYIAIASKDERMVFPLSIIANHKAEFYCAGYLIAMSSINLLKVRLITKDDWSIKTLHYPASLKKNVTENIEKIINESKKKSFIEIKKRIDSYIEDHRAEE